MLVIALVMVAARPVAAQSSRDIVGGPITTQRLERFLRAYVSPTDGESAAIDRLHESYLDRYRAEIEPEASTMMTAMSGRQPSKDEYEKFLRDLDRLQDKISEADNQFFASATELLAESRRGGMQRVRETRERQRLLSGIVQFAPMMLGGGAGFIDLPARAIREEYFGKVASENREAFDAALRSQEQRTLSQARTYNADVRKALVGFFDIMMSMQESMQAAGSVDPANPDSMPDSMKALEEQQRAMMEKLAALGADVRKSVKSNFEANRAGVAALAALLPEDVGLSLRLDVADAAANSVGFNMGGGSRPGMRTLGRRIERDPDITPEVKAEIARILTSWRREQAQASEKVAELVLDTPSQMSMFGMSGESEALEKARRQLREVGNNALKQIAAKLADNAPRYVTSYTGYEEDGTETEFYRVANATKPDTESDASAALAEAEQRSMFVDGSVATAPDAWDAADVVRVAQTIGLDTSAQSVIEAIVEGWREAQWEVQMNPIAARLQESAQKRMSTTAEGGITYDDSAVRAYDEARLQAARAVFELDEKLYTDLASALGLASDDPLLTLLRLERIDLAASRARGGIAASAGLPLPLSRVLASASIDPAIARAVIDSAKVELTAMTASLPDRVRERMELARRRQTAERVFASRDQASVERASREYGEIMLQEQRSDRVFGELLTKTLVDAFNAHAGDAAVANAFRRALLSSAYPDVYKRSDSAQSQLDVAQRLPGLTDDQRARIMALEAEYAAVYEKLSGEMIMPPSLAMTGAADEATWAEFQKRAEAVEKARFNRKERTEKVLAELRRVLGPDVAATVPGLVKDDDTASGNEGNATPWMDRDED